jgi:hypothetical protein
MIYRNTIKNLLHESYKKTILANQNLRYKSTLYDTS